MIAAVACGAVAGCRRESAKAEAEPKPEAEAQETKAQAPKQQGPEPKPSEVVEQGTPSADSTPGRLPPTDPSEPAFTPMQPSPPDDDLGPAPDASDRPALQAWVAVKAGQGAVIAALDAAEPLLEGATPDDLLLVGQLRIRAGTSKEAEPLLTRGIELLEASTPVDRGLRGQLLHELGVARTWTSQLEQATEAFTRAVEDFDAAGQGESDRMAEAVAGLGFAHLRAGEAKQAETHLRRAVEIAVRVRGEQSPHAAGHRFALARSLAAQDRGDEAIALLKAASSAFEAAADRRRAPAEAALGSLLRDEGELAEAEAAFARALKAQQAVDPPIRPTEAQLSRMLATVIAEQGRPSDALPHCEDAERIFRDELGDSHPDWIATNRQCETIRESITEPSPE